MALAMAWTSSAKTPAALTTTRAVSCPLLVVTVQIPSRVRPSPMTFSPSLNWIPFAAAFSARAQVSWKGFTMPAVGAQRAATAASETLGSMARSSSRSTILRSGTPFARPRARSSSSPGSVSSLVQTTSEPIMSKSTPSSSQSAGMSAAPSTLRRAMCEPVGASKPAWTMAEFAFEVPQQTSSSASMTQALTSRRESSRAMEQPETPAPTMATS